MATKKRKPDPWGDTAASPFSSTSNSVRAAQSFEDDFRENARGPNAGRKGYVQAEDGSWVPRSFYGGGGGGGGGSNAGRPGYVQAEDGSWVPLSFYAGTDQYGPAKDWLESQKPIEW